MTQHATLATTAPHPSWCDKTVCTVADSWPYGTHQSASHVITADPPVTVVAELHLTSTVPGLTPRTLLVLEPDTGDQITALPLTLHQAHHLRTALGRLLIACTT